MADRLLELGSMVSPPHLHPGRAHDLAGGPGDPAKKRALGQYFTPPAIVDAMWSAALEACARAGVELPRLQVLELAAGAGAFLAGAHRRGLDPRQILAVEIDEATRQDALGALPPGWSPEIWLGNATDEVVEDSLVARASRAAGVLIIGNPPYNGLSPLLKRPRELESVRQRLLPYLGRHGPRSGFRDDFAFFLALARRIVSRSARPGVICLILPRSLLDAQDYWGVREALCLEHRVEVLDVGPGAFPDALVVTAALCLSPGSGASYRRLLGGTAGTNPPPPPVTPLAPAAPGWILRPRRSLSVFFQNTDPLTGVLQRWFTPHKTGFDELLVSADRVELLRRLSLLVEPDLGDGSRLLEAFAAELGSRVVTPRVAAKLLRTRAWATSQPSFPDAARVRPYLRFNPRKARFAPPAEQWQQVYFEPRISALFNHAFSGAVGSFDPYLQPPLLLFNTAEARSYAMVVEPPAVVHLYQHTRFAPLRVPQACWDARGKPSSKSQDRGALRLNLTPAWEARAGLLRAADDLFHLVSGIANSALVRRLIAPECGTQEPLPIPRFDAGDHVQRIADLSRQLARAPPGDGPRTGKGLEVQLEREVVSLYLAGADPQPWLDAIAELPDA